MVRPLDIATQGRIRDRSRVIPREFVLVGPVTPIGGGSEVYFGFTNFGEDITTDIVDAWTASTMNRLFLGDNKPILSIDAIPLRIGVEIDTTNVTLNHLHPGVQSMVRGHECRNASAQILRGWLDPDSMLLAAMPRARQRGYVDGTPIKVPAIGDAGSITVKIVSSSRELTRVNPVKASREFYHRRLDDNWGRYAGTAGGWPIFWGEEKDKAG